MNVTRNGSTTPNVVRRFFLSAGSGPLSQCRMWCWKTNATAPQTTWQTNGRVRAIVYSGNAVYIRGVYPTWVEADDVVHRLAREGGSEMQYAWQPTVYFAPGRPG